MSTLRTDNIRTLDDTLNIPLTNIALKTDLVASTIAVTPTGGISQTDVQAALAGLDTRVTARQPIDATLTALAAVTTAADTLIYATGVDTFTTTNLTPFARTLIDDTTAAAARTTLGTTALILTASQTTSGAVSYDFTGIPAGIRRVTVILSGVSTNSTSVVQIQLGTSSGVENTGYSGGVSVITGAGASLGTYVTSGVTAVYNLATSLRTGHIVFTRVTGNTWVSSSLISESPNGQVAHSAGVKTLVGDLDRVRITTVNGTDLFDGGAVSILYEG